MDKVCSKCDVSKPIDDFYKHYTARDGYRNICKQCCRDYIAKWRQENLGKIQASSRAREKTDLRKKKRIEYNKTTRLKFPLKHRAYRKLRKALISGKLNKQPCEICGKKETEAHHEDYTKPLDVNWLCRKHHLERHNRISWMP